MKTFLPLIAIIFATTQALPFTDLDHQEWVAFKVIKSIVLEKASNRAIL